MDLSGHFFWLKVRRCRASESSSERIQILRGWEAGYTEKPCCDLYVVRSSGYLHEVRRRGLDPLRLGGRVYSGHVCKPRVAPIRAPFAVPH